MNDTRQYILLVDDDRGITEALSCALERPGRTLVLCSDVESAEIALVHYPVTHLVTDVQFSGSFGFEGLHFISRVHAVAPQCRVVLITGFVTDQLSREAFRHGASAVMSKPFGGDELESVLGEVPVSGEPYEVIRIPSIDEILRGNTIAPVFQPIVRLTEHGAAPFGFEALTRVRGRWLTGGPGMLFEYAARRARLADLNVVAMARSVEAAAALPRDTNIFINIDPLTFDGRLLVPSLKSAARRASLPLERIVLEVTERSAFADDEVAGRVFDELRDLGLRFALDDHGSAYSHLSLISRIKPSFIKMSQTFGTDFQNDQTKERIVRHTVSLANDFGCELILEGIESATTSRAAAAMGVSLAQGFHFGRPRAARHWLAAKSSLRAA